SSRGLGTKSRSAAGGWLGRRIGHRRRSWISMRGWGGRWSGAWPTPSASLRATQRATACGATAAAITRPKSIQTAGVRNRCRVPRRLEALDTVGPVALKQGTNLLLFKVVNESYGWEGCVRLVDDAGLPPKGIRVKLTP